MDIIIVRHGLSFANKKGLTSGRYNTDLTPEGKQQAKDLADRLAGHKIEQIYASPLKRTMETAMPIAERLGKSINVDARLIENSFGSYEGKPDTEISKAIGGKVSKVLDTYKYDFSEFGGETSTEVEARVQSFLDDLKKQPYKKVLIVSHGGVVRWLHYLITGQKIGRQPNAEELHLKA